MPESLIADLLKGTGPAALAILIMYFWLKDVRATRDTLRSRIFDLIKSYQKQNEKQEERLRELNDRIHSLKSPDS